MLRIAGCCGVSICGLLVTGVMPVKRSLCFKVGDWVLVHERRMHAVCGTKRMAQHGA